MKKILNIILCISIMVTTFDIIDANDITLNGKAVFHSQDISDNQDLDSMDIEGIHTINTIVFHINPDDINSIKLPAKNNKCEFVFIAEPVYNNTSKGLYRPPIV